MKVLLPLPSLASVNTVMCEGAEGGRTLIEKYKDRDLCSLVLLHSKDAAWDRKLNSYVLNYKGRANQVRLLVLLLGVQNYTKHLGIINCCW